MLVFVVRHPFRCSCVHHLCHEKILFGWIEKTEDGYSCKTRSKGWMDFSGFRTPEVEASSCGGSVAVRQIFADPVGPPLPAGEASVQLPYNRTAMTKPFDPATGRDCNVRSLPPAGRTGKDPVRRRTLLRIMQDERRHCEVLRSRTGRTVTPDPKRVLWYVGMVRCWDGLSWSGRWSSVRKARRQAIRSIPNARSSCG